MATGTTQHPAATEVQALPAQTPVTAPEPRRRARLAIPRSRGLVSGAVLVILGLWGAIIPFIGPYFGYEFGSDQAWAMTWNRLWLDVLPGAAVFIGGLVLIAARNRAVGLLGGWLALTGGAWFVAGPTVAMLWGSSAPGSPIGAPVGSEGLRVLELLGCFYALGAAAVAFAGFALGRLSVVGIRDIEAAAAAASDGPPDAPHHLNDGAQTDVEEPAANATSADGGPGHQDGAAKDKPRRRLFRRS